VLQGTRTRRPRIPPFRRRELPSIYLAVLVFGLVAPLLPPLEAPAVPVVAAPEAAPEPPTAPLPVQVLLVPASPVVPRAALLNKLADSHTVALTFDDGPDPRFTPQILAILQRHGAVATFCMVSRNVAGQEALVQQIVAAGMRICDHSHTHDEQLPDRDPERIADEVVGARRTLSAAAGGAPVEWFRAPGGNWSTEVAELSAQHGMQPLSWNIDPRDWERPGADAIVAAVQQQIRQQAPDGPIVLLHDGGGSREQTVEALEKLIPWLVEQGYRFGFPVP
jgi:peptidoglycan/xylan/chitin deacetylase (PgdA/CDA1 family)